MNKYPKYKPSDVEWIGEIPELWDLKRLKYEAIAQGGYAFKSDEFVEDGTPIIRIGDIAPQIDLDSCKKTSEKNIPAEFKLRKNDTLVALSGATVGKMCFVKEDMNAYINQRVARVTNGTKWLHHILNSGFFIEQIELTAGGSAQENISTNDFANFFIPIPPKPEQTAIATFLDEKTAQIDKLITNKQKLIELLKEERTAIINQAVTRGINPNVKLKTSSIDWIGDIPAHWEVKKLKYIINKIIDNRGRTPEYGALGIPMLEIKQIDGVSKYPKDSFDKFVDPKLVNEFVRVPLKKGDVLIATVGATAGKSAIVEKDPEYFIAQNLVGFRSNSSILSEFLFYVAQSIYFTEGLLTINKANTIDNLKVSIFINNPCVIPPVEEQNDILNYIATEIKNIDSTVSKIEKEIDLMQEYRTALIGEVVTGKTKVI